MRWCSDEPSPHDCTTFFTCRKFMFIIFEKPIFDLNSTICFILIYIYFGQGRNSFWKWMAWIIFVGTVVCLGWAKWRYEHKEDAKFNKEKHFEMWNKCGGFWSEQMKHSTIARHEIVNVGSSHQTISTDMGSAKRGLLEMSFVSTKPFMNVSAFLLCLCSI